MIPIYDIPRSISFTAAGDELLPLAQDPTNWSVSRPNPVPSMAQSRLVGDCQVTCVAEVRADHAVLLRISLNPPRPFSFAEMTARLFAFLGEHRFGRPPARWECRLAGGWYHFTTVIMPPPRGAMA